VKHNLDDFVEELSIRRVRETWAFGRDLGDWQALGACFHPQGTITVSWYSGPAAGFVERSREARAAMKPEERSKHLLGNMRVARNGERATLETDVQICVRESIDGYLFDYTSYARFFDLMVKHEGAWKIFKAACIYDKDRLDPVVPGAVPPSFFDAVPLAGTESGFACMRFRQGKRGRTVPPGIVLGGTPAEQALREEGVRWLAGAWPQ
jgi:hypothetical protein